MSVGWLAAFFLLFFLALSVLSRHFKFFKVSMAQETVEGSVFLGGATGGFGLGRGGRNG